MIDQLATLDWWMVNLVQYIVYSLILGTVLEALRRVWEHCSNAKYRNWNIKIVTPDNRTIEQSLYWEDVKRFRDSKFEKWKFVKSSLSGFIWLKLISVDEALNVWLFEDLENKEIKIDFTLIPEEHKSKRNETST